LLPESICKWMPDRMICLGTDGFGRSDGRTFLRDFFEVDERFITLAALHSLSTKGLIDTDMVRRAVVELDIDPEKANPMIS
jgi:pyruvate dehydrogenase E1 component